MNSLKNIQIILPFLRGGKTIEQTLLSYKEGIRFSLLRSIVLSWMTVCGLAGGLLLLVESGAPQVAYAYTSRMAISIDRYPGESYNALIQRSEAIARNAAQQSFDSDAAVTHVAIIVVGESEGLTAPLLVLEVNREQWRSHPVPQQWITYFATARELLHLENIADEQIVPTSTGTTNSPTGVTTSNVSPSAAIAPANGFIPIGSQSTGTESPESESTPTPNPVQINLPAAPSGELGLPRLLLN